MRMSSLRLPLPRLALALLAVIGAASLISSTDKPVFTTQDKAYYADPNLVDFIRPGLDLEVTGAEIAADGTIRARFKIADPRGLPLDREGVTTPGPVTVRFVAAVIPPGTTKYRAYTTRPQTSTITNRTETQAAADTNGTFQRNAAGEYTYTFATKAPADYPRGSTHSIGAWAHRDLSEFDLESIRDDDSDVFNFVPDGSAVTQVRDVVRTESCNRCHDPLQAHDERRTVELCILCHTPQTIDPDTGNTVDMTVMTHKIHAGAQLPSVEAGRPYQIVGFGGSVHDYSDVVFPANIMRCTVCHEQDSGATQARAFLENPSRLACGSCHDNVNFATGEGHVNLPQLTDNQCSNCHRPQGELPFDASIMGAHQIPQEAPGLAGTNFEITRVENGTAGQKPTVTFSIKDDAGNAIPPSQMSRLFFVMAGPTAEYTRYFSENAATAQGSGGNATYTFQNAIPADATGTWAIGIEGYRNQTLLPGTRQEQTVRDAGRNVVSYFAVDGAQAQPPRQVVSIENCNACHGVLTAHGDNRNAIEQCILCHNPRETDAARRPASAQPAATIDFKTMIHRIHAGASRGNEYTVYGFGGTPHNYDEVVYPGDLRNCSACHVNDTQELPVPEPLTEVTAPRSPVNPMGPAMAACTGCHGNIEAFSHALANTTTLGESCAACHGQNREFSVSRSHAR